MSECLNIIKITEYFNKLHYIKPRGIICREVFAMSIF